MISGMPAVPILIVSHHFHDLAHLAFQSTFDRFRLTFTSRDAAHVRGVDIEMMGDAT